MFCPVESIELLLQIIVEEYRASSPAGLEEETAAWVRECVHTHTLNMHLHTNYKGTLITDLRQVSFPENSMKLVSSREPLHV